MQRFKITFFFFLKKSKIKHNIKITIEIDPERDQVTEERKRNPGGNLNTVWPPENDIHHS